MVYRIYITDALKILGNLSVRYADYIKDDVHEASPEDIISRISFKLEKAGNRDESI